MDARPARSATRVLERAVRRPWLHSAACGLMFAGVLLLAADSAPVLERLLGREDMDVYSALSFTWMPGWHVHAWLFYEPGIGYCGHGAPGRDWTWLTVNAGNLLAWGVPAALVERLRVAWRGRRA